MHLFHGKKTNHAFLPFVEETVPLFSVSAFSERQLPAAGAPPEGQECRCYTEGSRRALCLRGTHVHRGINNLPLSILS